MGQAEIDALQEQVAAEEAAELELEDVTVSEDDAKAHFEMAEPPAADADLAGALTVFSLVAGNMICTACRVDPLSEAEAGQLGQAGAEVAKHYPGLEISPKAAAWFGLGMAGSAIITPRLAQYQARKAPEAPEDGPETPETPKEGLEGDPGDAAPLDVPQSPYVQ